MARNTRLTTASDKPFYQPITDFINWCPPVPFTSTEVWASIGLAAPVTTKVVASAASALSQTSAYSTYTDRVLPRLANRYVDLPKHLSIGAVKNAPLASNFMKLPGLLKLGVVVAPLAYAITGAEGLPKVGDISNRALGFIDSLNERGWIKKGGQLDAFLRGGVIGGNALLQSNAEKVWLEFVDVLNKSGVVENGSETDLYLRSSETIDFIQHNAGRATDLIINIFFSAALAWVFGAPLLTMITSGIIINAITSFSTELISDRLGQSNPALANVLRSMTYFWVNSFMPLASTGALTKQASFAVQGAASLAAYGALNAFVPDSRLDSHVDPVI